MLKNPSLQTEPLRHWLQIAAISVIVVVSVYFFFATLKMLIIRYGDPLPGLPPEPPAQATMPAEPTFTGQPTIEMERTAAPTTTPLPTETMTETAAASPLPSATPAPTLAETQAPTPAGSPTPTPKAGTVRKRTPSGITAVYIPAGKARIGDPNGGGNDAPRHTIRLSAYWISRTQVTNAEYARCVKAGGCTKPIRKAINPHYYDPAYARHPAVYITWDQAQAFCRWAGGSLPTEAQWEHAAAGNGERTFAWGEGEPASYFVNVNHPNGGTVEVGRNRDNASPFGVLDMGGNVREWVADWYSGSYYRVSARIDPPGPVKGEKKVLRGAGWSDPNEFSRVWHRLAHVPGSAGANRGFRCAFAP